MIDLFITTFGRKEVFKQSLSSLLENTDRDLYRLTIVVDGGSVQEYEKSIFDYADSVLWSKENLGLGPSINTALSSISTTNNYFDNSQKNFICMCQDDVTYQKGWLTKLVKIYNLYSRNNKIGFVSGHNAPEHKTIKEVRFGKDKLLFKPWIRATNMFTTREYFLSMFPIPRMDPETGRERARPHGGMGSGVDWWFIRNAENSVCRSDRVNIVYPGLIKHIGYNKSTWLDRDLPEDAS